MKKIFIICFFLNLTALKLFSQSDYFKYHQNIILSEKYLMNGNNKMAFELYQDTFSQFEFVFPRDCLIAAQFAYYYNQKEIAIKFLKKGFQCGLMPFHILRCPIYSKSDISFLTRMNQLFLSLRKTYLQQLNPEIIEKVLDIYWKDQNSKNSNPPYTFTKDSVLVLDNIKVECIDTIIAISKKYGFPGQKLVGILHNNILMEIGRNPKLDFNARFNISELIQAGIEPLLGNLNSFDFLSNDITLISALHHPCAFQKLGKDNLKQGIKNGYLYPNDYAVLYMAEFCKCFAPFKQKDSVRMLSICSNLEVYNGGYGIAVPDIVDTNIVNKNRLEIGMRTLQHEHDFYNFSHAKNIIVQFGMANWK